VDYIHIGGRFGRMGRPTREVMWIVEGDDRYKDMLMLFKAARFYDNHHCDSRSVDAGTIVSVLEELRCADDIGIELPRYLVILGEESEDREKDIYMYLCISDKEELNTIFF
jgi:hypothetical protein